MLDTEDSRDKQTAKNDEFGMFDLTKAMANGDVVPAETTLELMQNPFGFGYCLDIFGINPNKPYEPIWVMKTVEAERFKKGMVRPRALTISREALVGLMDSLYRSGIRPTGNPELLDGERDALKKQVELLEAELVEIKALNKDVQAFARDHANATRYHLEDLRKANSATAEVLINTLNAPKETAGSQIAE